MELGTCTFAELTADKSGQIISPDQRLAKLLAENETAERVKTSPYQPKHGVILMTNAF